MHSLRTVTHFSPSHLGRGFSLVVPVLALTAACGGSIGPVNYEPREPPRAPRAKTEVAMYDVDCREPTLNMTDCVYNGAPVGWKVLGAFHTPTKAAAKWGKYRSEVLSMASMKGCPAVAIRRTAPSNTGSEPIGAFCIDPGAMGGGGPTQPDPGATGGPAVIGTATATVSVPAHECNTSNDCPPNVKCTRGTCRNE